MVQVTDYTALLSGSTLTGQTGVAAFLSFSFPTTIPAYLYDQYRPDQLTTFRALTAAEQQQARAAIAMIADACGLKFFEVAPGEGDINFMVFDLAQLGNPNAAGFAYYPGNAYGGGEDIYSDVFLTSSAASSMHVLLHEIGHAVGLKHPFDGDINLTAELDNYTNTVMSYTSGGVSGNTLGLLDDDALRYLYGDANADGTQVSAWSWDGTTLTQTGSANAESIFGIGGRDIIQGLGGADLIYGRGGNDQLDGGDGDDQIWGGYGNDVLIGGNGADQLWGEEGADQLSGGIGNDVLYGGDGADVLDGGDGNDTLYGDAGLDVLIGGAGDDNIYDEVSGATLPTVDGGDGTDRLVLTFTDDLARSINTSSAFASIEDITLYLGGGNDVVQLGAASGLVDGGAGNDRIIAGSGFSWLYGGAGADTFVFDAVTSSSSSTRVDQLEDFQTGVDLIDITGAAPTSVTLSAASSAYLTANTANGQLSIFVRTAVSLNDVLATRQTGTAGADTLQGTEARDVLVGGGGNDILKGLGSDDTLSGGVGADTLSGGAGADTFIDTAANLSGDTITDWGSTDRIVISDANLSGFSFSLSGNVLSFTGGSLTLTNLPTGSLIASRAAEGGVQIAQFGSGLRDVAGDFNGDGRSDVVLQSSTGALSIWRGQASGALADAGNLNANSLDASWKVAGIGDFNGDGRDDILWRHSSGVIGEWTGQNGVFQNNSGVAANPVDNSWSVVGIADYNGDGRDDILWRHTSGELGQWLAQQNGSFANNGGAAANVVDPSWTVVASGDFNGDGKADILWRHTSGVYAEWQGSATGKLVNVGGVMSGSTSTVVGSGDFNGDGKADVLTRDAAGGAISVWLGQGSGQFTQTFPTQQLGDLNWKIVDIGDFNGDGRADLIWKHSSGVTGEWLGTATGDFVNNGATLTVPVGSTVQSPDIWLV